MKSSKKEWLFLLLVCCCLSCKKKRIDGNSTTYSAMSVDKFIDDWTCTINPGQGANFTTGEFRLWVPDPADVSKLKAVLILLGSYNSNSLFMANLKEWQKYAIANNLALMGVNLVTRGSTAETYSDAREGSGKALLMALEAIAGKNSVSRVASLPFLLRGHSAGGQFSYYFSAFKPKRTIAFATIRGWNLNKTPSENKVIPGLFLMEEYDMDTWELVLQKRTENGLWACALEPGVDHYGPTDKSDSLILKFFTLALKARTGNASVDLIPIPENSAWLGDYDTKTISSYDTYSGNKKGAFWLIDESFAKAWVQYQKQ